MLKRYKKTSLILLVMMVIVGCVLYFLLLPVKVIAVHQRGNNSTILVKHYPLTDKGKIEWWLKNKNMFQTKYNVPKPDESGIYNVVFWDFGDGYKEEGKYDRLCFDDMPPPKNCIDKNKLMIISHSKDNVTQFTVGNEYYILQDDGLTVKIRSY
ncbi:DUF943 family protein [Pantoea agglomerans]|uniref:DUF943 family protein n=1 Tax=Enterobacter agglomerans TaxID=549 RepID=A0ACC5RHP1_ENTAG|nr:DUF943 family protein [Pantoea agglomerans]MBK4724197.1 DUF943 family protein [Pantoea agglomerans]